MRDYHGRFVKGFKQPEEVKQKMRGPKKDKIGYGTIHDWIRSRLQKPDICPCCEEKPVKDISCYTGIYNRDIDNYVYLCRSCHTLLDFATGQRDLQRIKLQSKKHDPETGRFI